MLTWRENLCVDGIKTWANYLLTRGTQEKGHVKLPGDYKVGVVRIKQVIIIICIT